MRHYSTHQQPMSALETYLQKLDSSTYDCHNRHLIQTELKELAEQLISEKNFEDAKLADLNAQVFSVQKSFKYIENTKEGQIRGLSWQIKGIKTLEDGSNEPYYWPGVKEFTKDDFEYFEKRYHESQNLYVKTEYGLMVFFGSKTDFSKHNDFKRELFNELFQLSKQYYDKAVEDNRYIIYYNNTLQLALGVANESKLEQEQTNIINYIFNVILTSDIRQKIGLRIVPALSDMLSNNYSLTKKQVDFRKIINKNLEIASELEKSDLYSTLSVVDRCLKMEQQIGGDSRYLSKYKAEIYEKLAYESERNNSLAAVDFADKALRLYQQLKSEGDIVRLQNYYNEIRGKQNAFEFRQELPDEDSEKIKKQIDQIVSESDECAILNYFILTPWYHKIDEIKKWADDFRKQSPLLSIAPAKIIDKFGNTVDVYSTDAEREEYRFWQAYAINFQLGSQIMSQFFLKAYDEKKLSYDTVMLYLNGTWLNEDIIRNYNGHKVKVKPIDTLKPGLKRIFEELDRFYAEESYQCDFVTIIDSLTLKIESLLRNLCERVGIPTFKTCVKGSDELMLEKTLDVLLADIAHEPEGIPNQKTNFDEEDRIMIKFVLSEKAGLNLRNEVAHGLMDINDYNFGLVVILFSLIMKLSKYQIIERNGGEDEINS